MNNLELMQKRLGYVGGKNTLNRIDWQKNRDLEQALKYSDASEIIQNKDKKYSVLIEDISQAYNYDDKIISSVLRDKLKVGDIIYWFRNNTYWIVLSRDLEQTAIFHGKMRRCFYEELDIEGNKVRGAIVQENLKEIETIKEKDTFLKDVLNQTLTLYLPINSYTEKLDMYSKIGIKGKYWEVQSVNNISYEETIVVYVKQTYKPNENLVPEHQETVIIDDAYIDGSKEIKPYAEYTYNKIGNIDGNWSVDSSNVVIVEQTADYIVLKWNSGKSGNFKLSFGSLEQPIKVLSMF